MRNSQNLPKRIYFQSLYCNLRYVTLTVVLNPLHHNDREKCVLRV